MKASVIIITKNQKKLLQKSLPILLKQKIVGDYEIIVVDSGSTDGAVEYVKKLPVKLIQIPPENFVYAKAFNLGAKLAKGELLVRLSGDAIPLKEDFLAELLKPFTDEKVGGTYGRYLISGKSGYTYPAYWSRQRFPQKITRYHVKPQPLKILFSPGHWSRVTNFAGGCCAIRKNIWQIRPFNEKLPAGEDAEYSWFLHTVGLDIVCNPQAEVLHEHKIVPKKLEILPKWVRILDWEYLRYYLNKTKGLDPFEKLKF